MDFVRSHFGKMKPWPVAPFFIFFITFGWVQQQTQPKVIKKMKKGATGQSFIRKEVTSYKIHTLKQKIEDIKKYFTIPVWFYICISWKSQKAHSTLNQRKLLWIIWGQMFSGMLNCIHSFARFDQFHKFLQSDFEFQAASHFSQFWFIVVTPCQAFMNIYWG